MIKDFRTYINEGLFDRNQSEFVIKKDGDGVQHVYLPETKEELCNYIDVVIAEAKKDGTYPNVNLNDIDVSELESSDLSFLFSEYCISPEISSWDLKTIPYKFFYGNISIKDFTIPDSVTYIGDFAFCGCNHLTSIIIPNSVKRIAHRAFSDCSGLKYVSIKSNSIVSIEPHVFEDCRNLTSIKIPEGVNNIGTHAFDSCASLVSVVIPNSVTFIGDWAFYGCTKLKEVEINRECDFGTDSFPAKCNVIRK